MPIFKLTNKREREKQTNRQRDKERKTKVTGKPNRKQMVKSLLFSIKKEKEKIRQINVEEKEMILRTK